MINQIIFVLCIQFSYSQVQPEIEFAPVPEFSSTPSPAELFQQAIQDNVVSALAPVKPIPPLESPFANFDLPSQTPPVTPKPPRNNVLANIPDQEPPPENPNIFQPPRQDRRPSIRKQVDKFGNPLGDIHSTDTTRYELGSGGDPITLRCPRNWERFEESCYKFTRSPTKKWDDARELCKAFRHNDQDRADLASVDTFEEHRLVYNKIIIIFNHISTSRKLNLCH